MDELHGRIPEEMFCDRTLTPGAKIIYAYLELRADPWGDAVISHREIALALNVSRTHVLNSILCLERLGYLGVDRCYGQVNTHRLPARADG